MQFWGSIPSRNALDAATVIPGPPEGRSPEPMHTGLWKMGSGLPRDGAPE
jgi:hypothetical protein